MDRRSFTKLAGQCALGVGAVSVLPSCKTATNAISVTANPEGELHIPLAMFRSQANPNLLIAHPIERFSISLVELPSGGFSACLMRCTHQKCTTAYTETGYVCPCHGARFSHQGKVKKGPATENLVVYPVKVIDGEIMIKIG